MRPEDYTIDEPISGVAERDARMMLWHLLADEQYPQALHRFVRSWAQRREEAGELDAATTSELLALREYHAEVEEARAAYVKAFDEERLAAVTIIEDALEAEKNRRVAVEILEQAVGEDGYGLDVARTAADRIRSLEARVKALEAALPDDLRGRV